jgi:rhodanese-related sulfurtransferase
MTAPRTLGATALVLGALAAIVGSAEPSGSSAGSEPARISAAELAEWQHAKKGGLRVVDLRPVDAFEASHIPGAEDLPAVSLVDAEFSRTETILLYAETEARADQASVTLRARGLTRVYVLRGGFAEWSGSLSARRRGC